MNKKVENVDKEVDSKESVLEKLSDADNSVLTISRLKKELTLEKAKTALAQNDSATLAYDNLVLKLAIKYNLADGDTLEENGEIKRVKK